MKLIFLDVDGVFNCSKDWDNHNADGFETLDPVKCDNLKRIVEECNDEVKIVLSSTWRLHDDRGMEKLTQWLKDRGLEIMDKTPDKSWEPSVNWDNLRGTEIQEWFFDNPEFKGEPFIILDDVNQFMDHQQPFLILTSFDDLGGGLNEFKTEEAIRMINAL